MVVALSAAAALCVSGCGQGSTPAVASLQKVPLAPGSRIVWRARLCDKGSHAYCSLQFVVVGRSYRSSAALRNAQRVFLRPVA